MNCLKRLLVIQLLKSKVILKRKPMILQNNIYYIHLSALTKNNKPKSCHDNTTDVKNNKDSDCKLLNENELLERLKHRSADCRRKGNLSIAIVGGGYTAVYATILLKQNLAIKEIRLIDTDDSLSGLVCDIRHIDTSANVKHYNKESILDGVRNCDIVALMDETNFTLGNQGPFTQFVWSANYVKNVAECMINSCPRAIIAVFAHPVTANVPLVCEVFQHSGNWDPNKIIGSAALESMRISAMTANFLNLNPSCLTIPLAGGVDSKTIVPLLSQTRPFNDFSTEELCKLVSQLRTTDRDLCDSEVKGPTLSSGVAAAKFISILINGLKKESISIANAYVRSDVLPGCKYSTSNIKFGPKGVEKNYGLPKVSSLEVILIESVMPLINKIEATVKAFVRTGKIK